MGVLNLTPDSFSDGGRYPSPTEALEAARAMARAGAALIDVGGESTRPGAEPVSEEEELRRWCDENREVYDIALKIKGLNKNKGVHPY